MNAPRTADNVNMLGRFLGKRDLPDLSCESLQKNYGLKQADVFVLFGGSIICGGDIFAQAVSAGIAKKYLIIGGVGHTTQTLREVVHDFYPEIKTDGLPEVEVFKCYIEYKYQIKADFLKCHSTNCGNNIINMLKLIEKNGIDFSSVIMCQDAAMQYRMEATLKKYKQDLTIINYACYQATVCQSENKLIFQENIPGMWDMERYISLLMGEIPRLIDDINGYGPKGKDFISHINIPENVKQAFGELNEIYAEYVRKANPAYA